MKTKLALLVLALACAAAERPEPQRNNLLATQIKWKVGKLEIVTGQKMKQPEDYFSVTFIGRDSSGKEYRRLVLCLGVPRVGESVMVDDVVGNVSRVGWQITSGLPNGRSVNVFIDC